jgi:hypothetical protein
MGRIQIHYSNAERQVHSIRILWWKHKNKQRNMGYMRM